MTVKFEVPQLIKDFCRMVQTQFNKHVKILQSDNGKEFTCLHRFYANNGIIHQTSCVNTPQQNGRVEYKHRHILNMAWALLFQANLPLSFSKKMGATRWLCIMPFSMAILSRRSIFNSLLVLIYFFK
uniref:Retrovirus-related Pol polyprotein from transposon TNT 1-94 n=1 Tax=Cajanus cajan TaxID=3821 RepID=A0A151U7U9_CAJCA|nr:Retrovirus-related Pol polyprotein from transposon TNT 1-94 [Cajanus cajan]